MKDADHPVEVAERCKESMSAGEVTQMPGRYMLCENRCCRDSLRIVVVILKWDAGGEDLKMLTSDIKGLVQIIWFWNVEIPRSDTMVTWKNSSYNLFSTCLQIWKTSCFRYYLDFFISQNSIHIFIWPHNFPRPPYVSKYSLNIFPPKYSYSSPCLYLHWDT